MSKTLFVAAFHIDSKRFGDTHAVAVASYFSDLGDDGFGDTIVWKSAEDFVSDHTMNGPIDSSFLSGKPGRKNGAAAPAPAKVWIVQGEHWFDPGRLMEARASAAAAADLAAEWVNMLRKDVDLPEDATGADHEEKLVEAKKARAEQMGFEVDEDSQFDESEQMEEFLNSDHDNADVWITELEAR